MFDSLKDGLSSAFKSISGKGKLTEANMRDGLKLVEQSLIEADVSYEVVQRFMDRVREQALGEKVLLALKPSEQLFAIIYNELVNILGPVDQSLPLNNETNILMMCGLQGSGKTTTCGKLANLLLKEKITPMLVAADLQRPAAIEQLHVIGKQVGVPVYSEPGEKDPVKVCKNAVAKAKADGIKIVILDTAGRLAIDEELMEQLKSIDRKVNPDQVFLVVDGMTGQDAVKSAGAFNAALELNGVIMTKLDGDARGGALLSVKDVTGVPIKFIGEGEHINDLAPFRPEGMADRILGQGDLGELARISRDLMDEEEQKKLQADLEKGKFTLDQFRDQIQKLSRPGLMTKMMAMLPGVPPELTQAMGDQESQKEMRKLVGIIDSMTPKERRDPKMIDNPRRARIARGAGVEPRQVNEMVKQFDAMKSMMEGGMKNPNQMMDQFKESALGGKLAPKQKKSTGRRLSAADKKRMKKEREKRMRQKKRDKRRGGSSDEDST